MKLYLLAVLFYFVIFLSLSFLYYKFFDGFKKKDRIKTLEESLLWNIPKYFKIIFPIIPKKTKNFLLIYKEKLIELQLVEILTELITSSESGVSCFDTLEEVINELKEPIKNEIKYFLIYAKKSNIKTSIEDRTSKAQNIFLKQFWQILHRYLISGGVISKKLSRLRESILLKINIKQKINARTLNNKIQLVLCIVIPYFMFCVVNLIIPDLFFKLLNSKTGILLILFSASLHCLGIIIFKKIVKFNYEPDLKKAIFINYISFALENGLSFYDAFFDIAYLIKVDEKISEEKKNTYELIEFLNENKDLDLKNFCKIINKSLELGSSASKNLNNLYTNIIEGLEYRVQIFEQKIASLTLIPLFIFIFPATYFLILSPILLELFK